MNKEYFGHALYYPYIHMSDDSWLKLTALYYDGLSRIVPENYIPNDSSLVKTLIDQFDFIKNIDPEYAADQIASDFLKFASEKLSDKIKRRELFRNIQKILSPDTKFRIHFNKMAQKVKEELPRLGLASLPQLKGQQIPGQRRRSDDWYEFEPVTGAIYMSFLANQIAENNALPVITDDPVYQPLIHRSQLDRFEDRTDKGLMLGSLIIATSIPENLENVTIKQIIDFRRLHESERLRFYEGIKNLAEQIPTIEEPSSLKDCLEHHQKTIELATEGLKLSLKSVGISCATTLLGLSVPSWASKLAEQTPSTGVQIAAGGLVAVGITKLIKEGMDYNKSKRESPWSYVLSLRKGISYEDFLTSLLKGKIIL